MPTRAGHEAIDPTASDEEKWLRLRTANNVAAMEALYQRTDDQLREGERLIASLVSEETGHESAMKKRLTKPFCWITRTFKSRTQGPQDQKQQDAPHVTAIPRIVIEEATVNLELSDMDAAQRAKDLDQQDKREQGPRSRAVEETVGGDENGEGRHVLEPSEAKDAGRVEGVRAPQRDEPHWQSGFRKWSHEY